MDIYPAVDLLDGRSVRLLRGDFSAVTDYGDPVEAAVALASTGAPWLHVVDLEAARTGKPHQRGMVRRICEAVDVPVQAGGGVRTRADVDQLLSAGVARVVLGTAALEEPDMVRSLCDRHPGAVAVGLDHRGPPGRRLASRGWESDTGWDVCDAAVRFEDAGVAALVVTSIPTDGTLEGPDLEGLAMVLEATTRVSVIASGGVGCIDHLEQLASVRAGGRALAGAIVGRAAHDGRVDVAEAVRRCGTSV
ncbi:MAG: HisA/HisF-related TIM barrel protein [Actinomycetota bacterium]|nr:HisA/HisF-related TIM barrel protein [Actinomycetota bacterium]